MAVPVGAGAESPGRAHKGEAAGVSHIVMQEEGDPVGGVVQEEQPLQEAGQERGRLFYKHSQKHPGGRLEDTTRWGSENSPGPQTGVSSTTLPGWESPGALARVLLPSMLSLHPLPQYLVLPTPPPAPPAPLLTCPPGSVLRSRPQNPQPPWGVQPLGT